MKDSRQIASVNAHEELLREFDLRELDAADPRGQWALKYRERLRRVLEMLGTAPAEGRVLEVGCSQANTSLLAAEAGWTAIALDREPRSLAYARRKHERGDFAAVAGDALALPFGDRAFGAVLLLELLEHLSEPGAALREAHRVMAPGGLLIVTTPNAAFIHERLPDHSSRPNGPARRGAVDAGGHLCAFRLRTLCELVERGGFRPVGASYTGSVLMADRNPLKRAVPVGLTLALSRLVNRLPGAAALSYHCLVWARKEETR